MVVGHSKGHTDGRDGRAQLRHAEPRGLPQGPPARATAKFGMPIVTPGTPGGLGLGGEERGQSIAIAQSIMEMSRLPVPIVTIVTGEGGSGGALALAVGDRVLMLENSYYSVISPEVLDDPLQGRGAGPRAAEALRLTAPHLLRLGVMDGVVPEPAGAHANPAEAASNLKAAVVANLQELLGVPPEELLERRYERFRAFGMPGRQVVLAPPGGEPMTEENTAPDKELIRSVWEEARDLVKRLEGTTVQKSRSRPASTRSRSSEVRLHRSRCRRRPVLLRLPPRRCWRRRGRRSTRRARPRARDRGAARRHLLPSIAAGLAAVRRGGRRRR